MTSAPRILVLVHARAAEVDTHAPAAARGPRRRADFLELRERLGARLIDLDDLDAHPLSRWLRRRGLAWLGFVLLALHERHTYDVVWCLSEAEGLVLGLLFRLLRIRKAALVIGIETLSPKALLLAQRLRAIDGLAGLFPTNTHQVDELTTRHGLPIAKVRLLPYQVDTAFFDPRWAPEVQSGLVVAAGLESRDYDTLLAAQRRLGFELVIAAASHWSGRGRALPPDPGPRVTIRSFDYTELRDLYGAAAVVVLPLHPGPYQHGITSLQEAMAMGRPVVATRTLGQGDLLADRRATLRGPAVRSTTGCFARLYRPHDQILHGHTGLYVRPHDPDELARALEYLLSHPELGSELGARGRSVVEATVSLDLFLERVRSATHSVWQGLPFDDAALPSALTIRSEEQDDPV